MLAKVEVKNDFDPSGSLVLKVAWELIFFGKGSLYTCDWTVWYCVMHLVHNSSRADENPKDSQKFPLCARF